MGKIAPGGTHYGLLVSVVGLVAVPLAYADTSATWNSTVGNWSDVTKWTTNPNFPNNGTPAGTLYDVTVSGGTVALNATAPTIQTLSLTAGTISAGSLTVLGAFNATGGALSNVALTGEVLMSTTSATVLVSGTTSFTAARLQANNASISMAPGYTLNTLASA